MTKAPQNIEQAIVRHLESVDDLQATAWDVVLLVLTMLFVPGVFAALALAVSQ